MSDCAVLEEPWTGCEYVERGVKFITLLSRHLNSSRLGKRSIAIS